MAIFTRIIAGMRALLRKRDVERELDAELRDYLDAAIEERMAAGMSRDEAVRTARADIGSPEAVKVLVRMAPDAERVEMTLRQTLHGLDANLPFVSIETLGEVLNPQIRPWRLGASVFTAFGMLAVILAVIGLWSSVAYAVSQRTQEFAVRMTLGAQRSSLVALMLKEGMRNALGGSRARRYCQPLHCRSLQSVLARSARVHHCPGGHSRAGHDSEPAASLANFAN